MDTDLTLHELTGSPNNVKVRIGLGYKGLKYERKPVALDGFPGNREAVVALSRQPRLPVLQHGKTVIFPESSAEFPAAAVAGELWWVKVDSATSHTLSGARVGEA